MLSYAVRCGAVRCGAVRCGAVRCGAVRCGAVRCGAVRCGAVLCCTVLCYDPLHKWPPSISRNHKTGKCDGEESNQYQSIFVLVFLFCLVLFCFLALRTLFTMTRLTGVIKLGTT